MFSYNIRDTEIGLVSGLDSRRILRFRTSAIDLIHSERVLKSTSSFFAHCPAYFSHASMIMPKFWCHEYETGSLYFGFLLKRSLSFILRTKIKSLHTFNTRNPHAFLIAISVQLLPKSSITKQVCSYSTSNVFSRIPTLQLLRFTISVRSIWQYSDM